MRKITIGLFLVTCLMPVACHYEDMAASLTPRAESEFAKGYLQKLRDRDFEFVRSPVDPALLPQVTDEKLRELAAIFPEGEMLSTELIGSWVHKIDSIWQAKFTFEYQFSRGWAVADVTLKRVNDELCVLGFNVHRTRASQKEINAFSITDKSITHYAILSMAVIVPIFILVSLYSCIRTPIPKRKWFWIVFLLFGVCSFSINWTTGAFVINLLSVHILGAAAIASGPHAPWIIITTFPLGAVLFWIKRRKYVTRPASATSVSPSGDGIG